MRRIVLIFIVSLTILSCKKNDDNHEMLGIEVTLISKNNLYGDGAEGISEQNIVISDTNTWTDLMAQMDSVNNVSSSFSETDINFNEFMVIAAFDVVRGNGGHLIELKITTNSDNIIVNITDLFPQGNATHVITQPFHIVKIPITSLPIIFE